MLAHLLLWWRWQINFEDCWLEYISPAAFSGLERLSSLNLVNNELRTLDSSMHATLPMTVRVLRLYRNPWTCDCRLRWLRLWTGAEDARVNWDFASNTPTCAAPALIRGVAWRHLSADQFACPSRIVRLSSGNQTAATSGGIHAPPGLNASITCTAAGDPQPIISWSRGDGGDGQVLGPPRAVISVTQGTVGDDGEPRIVGVLTLLGVSASRDSGDYSCMAENTAGRAEMTFKLIVSDSPLTGATSTSSVDRDVFLGTRDVFLGTLLGLLTVACVVILCTVLRLRSIARQRQRRSADSKNVHYSSAATTTDTATNHVSPLPTSNHRSVADVESAQTASALTTVDHDDDDDDDSRSSEERSSVVDGEQTVTTTAVSSPRRPLLLPNHHNQRLWTAAEQQQRRRCSEDNCDAGRRSSRNREKYCDAAARRQQLQRDEASRSLLSTEPDTRFLEEEEEEEEEEDTHENYDNDDDGTASVSDRQSEVATSDAETTRTNGDDDTTNAQRERGASRAVSFGPDMIIDARRRRSSCSSSVQGDSEAAAARDDHDMFNDGAGGDCTKHSDADVDDRSRTQRHRRDESPASILHQRPPAPAAVDYSPLCSPPTAASRSSTPDRRANPPGLSDMVDSLAPRSTYSTRPTERGASHGGELRLVGNGSVRTGTGAGVGSRLADHHPLSPQTTAPQSSSVPPPFSRGLQSASLDRCLPARTRRRLPVPSNTGLRRSTAPRLFSGQTAW